MKYQVQPKFRNVLKLIDFAGEMVFEKRKKPKKITKICVLRTDHIGDMLVTTPLFTKLKSKYPKAKLTVITRRNAIPIIKNNYDVDEIIEFDPPWFARGKHENYAGVLEFTKKYKKEFDICFEPKGDPRNIIVARKISKYCIGYGVRGFGFLLDKTVPWKKNHIVENILNIINEKSGKTVYNIPTKIENKIKKMLPEKYVCCNIGAGSPEKLWPFFPKFIEKIAKDHKVIVTDVKKHKTIPRSINMCGKLNLDEFASVVKNCSVYIGLDSLGTHMAATFDKPILSLQCPHGKVWQWGPYSNKAIVIDNYLDEFCTIEEGKKKMARLSVEKVYKNWQLLLSKFKVF